MERPETPLQEGSKAAQSCVTCRTQRRKCSKNVPSCISCQRLNRTCVYERQSPRRSDMDELKFLRRRVQELESRAQNDSSIAPINNVDSSTYAGNPPQYQLQHGRPRQFPAIFFLDSTMFSYLNMQISSTQLQDDIDDCEPMRGDHEAITAQYFATVQKYFPIGQSKPSLAEPWPARLTLHCAVSKIRLGNDLRDDVNRPDATSRLLIKCMQLHLPAHQNLGICNEGYSACKALYRHLEAQNNLTLRLIQSLLLITLYEVNNAMYPAAYLSVGHCARLAICMGLHDEASSPQVLPTPCKSIESLLQILPDDVEDTLTEIEERRRVWWAVLLLDRYTNLGHDGRPLACPDPRSTDPLPQDDFKWDQAVSKCRQFSVVLHEC